MTPQEYLIKSIIRVIQYVLCGIITIITAFPFVIILITSFKSTKEYFNSPWALPQSPTMDNFKDVFQIDFLIYFRNSFVVCIIAVFLIIMCATMASFAITKLRFKGSRLFFAIIMIGMMIPVHTTLIPIYVMSKELGIYNTLTALIGPYVSFSIPVSTIIIVQFFEEIPNEVEEAATIDGCGTFQLFGRIILPLAKPAISTVIIYDLLHTWNEFIYAMTLIDSKHLKTLPVGLKDFFGDNSINVPAIMCAVLVGSLPVIIAYFSAQEQVINGLTSGAVKG